MEMDEGRMREVLEAGGPEIGVEPVLDEGGVEAEPEPVMQEHRVVRSAREALAKKNKTTRVDSSGRTITVLPMVGSLRVDTENVGKWDGRSFRYRSMVAATKDKPEVRKRRSGN